MICILTAHGQRGFPTPLRVGEAVGHVTEQVSQFGKLCKYSWKLS